MVAIYDLDKLSEPARQHAMNIEIVDQEIRRLQVQLMIYQTAAEGVNLRPSAMRVQSPDRGTAGGTYVESKSYDQTRAVVRRSLVPRGGGDADGGACAGRS
jgi:hypothetical protein